MYFHKRNDMSISETRAAMPAVPFESCSAPPPPATSRSNLKCTYCDYDNAIGSQTCEMCEIPLILPSVPAAPPQPYVFVPVPGSERPGEWCMCTNLCDRIKAGEPACLGIDAGISEILSRFK